MLFHGKEIRLVELSSAKTKRRRGCPSPFLFKNRLFAYKKERSIFISQPIDFSKLGSLLVVFDYC